MNGRLPGQLVDGASTDLILPWMTNRQASYSVIGHPSARRLPQPVFSWYTYHFFMFLVVFFLFFVFFVFSGRLACGWKFGVPRWRGADGGGQECDQY